MEVDDGRVTRIGRAQLHVSFTVLGVRLENYPGQLMSCIGCGKIQARIAVVISLKPGERDRDEKIGVLAPKCLRCLGLQDDATRCAIASVRSLAFQPLGITWIVCLPRSARSGKCKIRF